MVVYQDLISGDELLTDSFTYTELFNGILWEVQSKWVTKGAPDAAALSEANSSAEGGGEDESVDDNSNKVIDIIDTFRLLEQFRFGKVDFVNYIEQYFKTLVPLLPRERQGTFINDAQPAVNFLVTNLRDLQFYRAESAVAVRTMVYSYSKDENSPPTFLYFRDALKAV